MTNKELKNLIKNAYDVEPSLDKKAFLKQYQKRELHMFDLVKQQLGSSIGIINILVGICVLFFYWQILLQMETADFFSMVRISGVMPVVAVTAISGFGRSERFRMDELEMSTRFSLRTVTMARLIVIGVIDMIVIVMELFISKRLLQIKMIQMFLIITVPYLIATSGCLMITRKLHSKNDIALCIVFEACICFICTLTNVNTPWNILFLGTSLSYIIFAILCVLLGIEINKLIKGDNKSWNLC